MGVSGAGNWTPDTEWQVGDRKERHIRSIPQFYFFISKKVEGF